MVTAKVLSVLRDIIPTTVLARHFGKEMSFILPHNSVNKFKEIFQLLDLYKTGQKKDLMIEDYGISMTTLEEVTKHFRV